MPKRQVRIYTEAGPPYGLGHWSRCKALYDAFEFRGSKSSIDLFIQDMTIEPELPDYSNYDCRLIDWQKAKPEPQDIVVIDSYLADSDCYQRLNQSAAVAAFLDDYDRLEYPSGMVINPAVQSPMPGYVKSGHKCLLGQNYCMLQKVFWEPFKTDSVNESVSKILFTVGGMDHLNLSTPLIDLISKVFPGASIIKIGGNSSTNLPAHVTQYNRIGSGAMRKLMQSCDMAISAAGQTMLELIATGIPTLAIVTADNQNANYQQCVLKGVVSAGGSFHDEEFFSKLQTSLGLFKDKEPRTKLRANCFDLSLGKGALRVVDQILGCNHA
jgi:spore coat polysaccharide biosynthesis predicted glycosyltransferase SpsG